MTSEQTGSSRGRFLAGSGIVADGVVAGDLTSAFDCSGRRSPRHLTQPDAVPAFTGRWHPTPPADQEMPMQEPGTRPARPLLHQPEASARLSGRQLTLTLTNTGAESVHFALYPYLGELAKPEHFDVDRRHREEITLTGDAYALVLTGPNGFRREFKGAVRGVAAEVVVTAAPHSSGKALEITVDNHGKTPLTVTLAAQAYGSQTRKITIPGRGRQSVPFTTQHGWYDVAVTVAQDGSFKRRLAGHLENGEPSISG